MDIVTKSPVRLVCIVLGCLVFLYTLYVTAWVGDDAYISFRVVDNFLNGYGLRWNVAERVWVYTNSLWVLIMIPLSALTREYYFTTLALGAVLSTATLVLLCMRLGRSIWQILTVMIIAIGSRAFVDYSTSGLENPLTHFLLVCFWISWFKVEKGERRYFWLCLWTALILVNRMDSVLLVAPALLFAAFDQPIKRTLIQGLVGFLPFIVWELFALWYYGMPFPNTFYAKTHSGVSTADLVVRSWHYMLDTFHRDPITLAVIFGGVLLALAERSRDRLVIPLGILLSLVYIARVGGDFMSGRFFTALFVGALVVIVTSPLLIPSRAGVAIVVSVLVLAVMSPFPPILSDKEYGSGNERADARAVGVGDQRRWYYGETGLLVRLDDPTPPLHHWGLRGKEARERGDSVFYEGCVGFSGLEAGPGVNVVDMYALSEPLYSRLPTDWLRGWRVGHFVRSAPDGYRETLALGGVNQLTDSNLSRYYNKLWLLTRGDLWSIERLKTIILFNLGHFDSDLKAYASLEPVVRHYADISTPRPRNTPRDDPGNLRMRKGGVIIELDSLWRATRLELSIDHDDEFYVVWFRGSREVAHVYRDRRYEALGGLRYATIATPVEALAGYDRIQVIPCSGDDKFALGHIRLFD